MRTEKAISPEKSKDMEEKSTRVYEEIGPQCETLDNYNRNILAGLRNGTASESDVRKLLIDQIDITIYSIKHLDEDK